MIVSQLTGGLGNQMFQYAFGRYLSKKYNTDLLLDTSIVLNRIPCGLTFNKYELGIFNLKVKIATVDDIPQYTAKKSVKNIFFRVLHLFRIYLSGYKYKREGQFHFYSQNLNLPDNVYLDGYWQTEKYFKEIESTIREDFSFNFPLTGAAKSLSAQVLDSQSVCVHIRRGDYLKVIQHHGVVGVEYISKGVELMASKVSNVNFFIFSDDIEWCKEHIKLAYPTCFVTKENAGNEDKEHFQLMTLCKHFIIANSTFSWWAAWLSANPTKIVIAPKQWVANQSINTSDIIPESWIQI